MALGFSDRRRQQRSRRRLVFLKWLLVITGLGIAGVYAYETGSVLARWEVQRLDEQVGQLTTAVERLKLERATLQADRDTLRLRERELIERYNNDMPRGRPAELLGLIEEKLAVGFDADRLAFVINQSNKVSSCEDNPTTKRFIARTPISRGGNDSVGFFRGLVTVTASGVSAVNAAGQILARIDPALPVVVTFKQLGGSASQKKGVLPLHHSIVSNDKEYRFTIIPADNGFVRVTADRCRYP
jgi:hypothetical protein